MPTADDPASNQKYCRDCGGVISRRAEICPLCGVRQSTASGKNKVITALFGIILGSFGVHKFYLGKPVQGIVYLIFCWTFIPAVAGFIEGLVYLSMSDQDFRQKYDYAEARVPRARGPHVERLPLSTVVVRATVALTALGGLAYLMKNPQTPPSAQIQSAASVPSSAAPNPPNIAPTPLQAAPSVAQSVPKSQSTTQVDGDKGALTKIMSDAVAAHHGGVLPKTMSEQDINFALHAATKWTTTRATQTAKQDLEALKVKPAPSGGDAEISFARAAITRLLRDPESAVFGDVFFVNDRKTPTGYYVPIVCGTVNGKNGFGGMTGQMHFVALISDIATSGVWLEGTTPQNDFAPQWNRYCAGGLR